MDHLGHGGTEPHGGGGTEVETEVGGMEVEMEVAGWSETLNAKESRGFFRFSRVNILRVTGSRRKQPVVRMHPFERSQPIHPFHIYMDRKDWLTPRKAAKIKMSGKG
ncbi:hypothetical protein EYF80_028262 [Liparis tanakae]|uniref:Uncharacterized protein n=1 Tax=Liparis tanakae TaxID=230148 RepID=A0A4Z2H6I4_9TELE|nr:hypothetical protein EYF80_028262 [Liparis tanakae]